MALVTTSVVIRHGDELRPRIVDAPQGLSAVIHAENMSLFLGNFEDAVSVRATIELVRAALRELDSQLTVRDMAAERAARIRAQELAEINAASPAESHVVEREWTRGEAVRV